MRFITGLMELKRLCQSINVHKGSYSAYAKIGDFCKVSQMRRICIVTIPKLNFSLNRRGQTFALQTFEIKEG